MPRRSSLFLGLLVYVCNVANFVVGDEGYRSVIRPDGKPNIIVILCDDLGYSDLGCYGGEIETPNIDALAKKGVKFRNIYNSARCCPSRASLMTGLYPTQAGIGDFTTARPDPKRGPGYLGRLNQQCATLAEVLKPNGYRNYYVGKWHLHPETGPIRRGFDEFFGYTDDHSHDQYDPRFYSRFPKDRKPEIDVASGNFYATSIFNAYAMEFIEQGRMSGQPWLLFLSHSSPHFPLQAPVDKVNKYIDRYEQGWDVLRQQRFKKMKELGLVPRDLELPPRSNVPVDEDSIANGFAGETNPPWDSLSAERKHDLARRMSVFAAMVEMIDDGVGEMVQYLDKTGELGNTMVLFLSDNGACYEWGPFGFDGNSRSGINRLHVGSELGLIGGKGTHQSYGSGWANLSNTPLRSYKHFTYEGGISSPFIFCWPTRVSAREGFIEETIHVMDIMPTLLEITHTNYPPVLENRSIVPMTGRSFLSSLYGTTSTNLNSAPIEEREIGFDHEGAHALVVGNWKVVRSKREVHPIEWELYDLRSDPFEQLDLAAENPERLNQMIRSWESWARKVGVEWKHN